MSLIELANNDRTDKNTVHSYLELYDKLLMPIKQSASNVLEVGIYKGGSIKMWHDYFQNANVYGIDIMHKFEAWSQLNQPRITLHCQTDAYDQNKMNELFGNIKFDMMLDDGPHTLDSQIRFIKIYSNFLSENGILMIEDVQDISWLDTLIQSTPENLKQYIKTYDLRNNKGRYDDIVFTIDKTNI